MNILAQEPWAWTLYADGDARRVLTVLVGGAALYEVAIELTPAERAAFEAHGTEGLSALIADLRDRPSAYTGRQIPVPG